MTSMMRASPLVLAVFALVACSAEPSGNSGVQDDVIAGERTPLGLMTSLPIYWPSGVALDDLVDGDAQLPWMRTYLEQRFELTAFDTLSADQQATDEVSDEGAKVPPLDGLDALMIIQPRGLSPADNVALDEWVAAGGQVLLALDPLLVGHYAYPLGDPRNPVLSTLVPPIMDRWGLSLSFSERQPLAIQSIAYEGGELPMVMSGVIALEEGGTGQCTLEAEGRIANCTIGEGRAIVVADATIFEIQEPSDQDKVNLQALLDKAFG